MDNLIFWEQTLKKNHGLDVSSVWEASDGTVYFAMHDPEGHVSIGYISKDGVVKKVKRAA